VPQDQVLGHARPPCPQRRGLCIRSGSVVGLWGLGLAHGLAGQGAFMGAARRLTAVRESSA
jgi:hypothetical protein